MPPNIAHALERTTFATSRSLEFFSEKELSMQLGADRRHWPITLVKELIDNALDACESVRCPPEITITLAPDSFSVRDTGPGLPEATLLRSLDYLVRVSDKNHYVSPSRGQLGNALKCVWAAPFVADGQHGHVEITANGVTHQIDVSLDRVAQQPQLDHSTTPGDGFVKNGTFIKIHWPELASLETDDDGPDFYKSVEHLLLRYALFNPHATLTVIAGETSRTFARTAPAWQKWLPSYPTSAQWYDGERLRTLIAAYLTKEQDSEKKKTVREFVSEFHGLTASAKQKGVLAAAGLAGTYLHDLIQEGDLAAAPVQQLLLAMQQASRPVPPPALGVLGEAHLKHILIDQCGLAPDSVKYKKSTGCADGLPYVVEAAFGWRTDENCQRELLIGLNFSPVRTIPFDSLAQLLGKALVQASDPVVMAVHVTCPRLDFVDRAKSRLILPAAISAAFTQAITQTTKHWTAIKRQADRHDRAQQRDLDHYLRQQRKQFLNVKEASYQVMEESYLKASGNGQYPASARQIMYAARPEVMHLTNGKLWKRDEYFTQRLLPAFLREHPEQTQEWDVVFDARGHLREPHTAHMIGLGTLEVRAYCNHWHAHIREAVESITLAHDCPTKGPGNRYQFALFVEKEGFNPLLEKAQIAERYDLAIMSTKGMSVTASRQLVERLTAQKVVIGVLHDFDKAGFSILHTLAADTDRYQYSVRPNIVDLGLRLADVQQLGLESERVSYDSEKDPRQNLRASGASEAECRFLVQQDRYGGWTGKRVELNAMTSPQFVAWLEAKLIQVGAKKVVPNRQTLDKAYRRLVHIKQAQDAIDAAMQRLETEAPPPPPCDLAQQIRRRIDGTPKAWDEALWDLVKKGALPPQRESARRP